MDNELLKRLPSVDELLRDSRINELESKLSKAILTDLLREVLGNFRNRILEEKIKSFSCEDIIEEFEKRSRALLNRNLKKVINASGIVVHTNLGRSMLSRKAIKAVIEVSGNYNNLEYDLDKGERGSRYIHIEELIKKITGAEAAVVVNNNAAAIMLVLSALCRGKEAIVSRGQLVEIGGSFRVPEVMELSGANLVEVGTTNKTHLSDYERAIGENTGAILKVHTSNFKIIGFTESVDSEDLVKLGRKNNIPVVEDIGSGVLIDFSKYGLCYEPTVQECIKKGVDVVTFSGDKMLGGPQCGIILGKKEYIDVMKKHQLLRALRVDKTCLAALEATLLHYLKEEEAVGCIPTLNMILSSDELHKRRALGLKRKLSAHNLSCNLKIKESIALVGGGAMPGEAIKSYAVSITSERISASKIEKFFRNYKVPIITRLNNEEVVMDLRTLQDEEFEIIIEAFKSLEESLL